MALPTVARIGEFIRRRWTQAEITSRRFAAEADHAEGAAGDMPAAIEADTTITRPQRQVMIDIYESFQRQNRGEAAGPAPRDRLAERTDSSAGEGGGPMTFADEVKKITRSKPFYAVAGAGGYAVEQWRRLRQTQTRHGGVRGTTRDVLGRTRETMARDLPRLYDDLAVRGRELMGRSGGAAADDASAATPTTPHAPGGPPEPVVQPSPAGAPTGSRATRTRKAEPRGRSGT
ncbi:hypothetical protein [Nonomuraea indica]|uniref:Uncharacterized protein n=1 Tax=Nonomuraea indica TaxID=1581193 RepID=A0ABW8A3K7_9ACTN